MTILIIGALEEEIDGVKGFLKGAKEKSAGVFKYTRGKVENCTLLVCRCGVGKTNSAAATSAILACEKKIDGVINIGVAGGIGEGVKRGDIVLGERTVHHDYDQTPDGLKKGQVQGFDSEFFYGNERLITLLECALRANSVSYKIGIIASGDQFIASDSEAKRIYGEFGALACDFESAPIAQVCHIYGVPFVSMRAISDNGGDGAVESFYSFLTKVIGNSTKTIAALCKLL